MKTSLIFLIFALISLGIFLGFEYKKIPESYRVTFLDIHLGDATLIQTPDGKNILVDTGDGSDIVSAMSTYFPVWNKQLDVVLISHGDSDHIGGMPDILKRFDVKEILFTGADKKSPVYETMMNLQKEYKVPFMVLDADRDLIIDKNIMIDVIYPFEDISYMENHTNNESLVFNVDIFGEKMLFTGDIEEETEEAILLHGDDIDTDILKVAHHGSKSSSIEPFLEATTPDVAIISADIDNRFGHPHQEVLDRLTTLNIQTLQTGREGDISFCITEERKIWERCQ